MAELENDLKSSNWHFISPHPLVCLRETHLDENQNTEKLFKSLGKNKIKNRGGKMRKRGRGRGKPYEKQGRENER